MAGDLSADCSEGVVATVGVLAWRQSAKRACGPVVTLPDFTVHRAGPRPEARIPDQHNLTRPGLGSKRSLPVVLLLVRHYPTSSLRPTCLEPALFAVRYFKHNDIRCPLR